MSIRSGRIGEWGEENGRSERAEVAELVDHRRRIGVAVAVTISVAIAGRVEAHASAAHRDEGDEKTAPLDCVDQKDPTLILVGSRRPEC